MTLQDTRPALVAEAASPSTEMNSAAAPAGEDGGSEETGNATGSITGQRLRSFIERVERLHEERKALSADIAEVYAEAKGQGFDVKTMKKIVQLRTKDPDQRAEEDAILETYLSAIGM